jgi:predicted RNA binding protein YcfA (HicA-like mRNA interferase family)
MPRLNCTFAHFIAIIEAQGFILHRHGATSHRIYRRDIGGDVRLVTVAFHRINDPIRSGTLSAMIRQSGLPKALFRN